MYIYLIDGTYELFRAYFGAPSARDAQGREVGATRALLRSFAGFLREADERQPADGPKYVAVAFDTVIESFRNKMFEGYKTGAGVDAALLAQFELAERATRALGMVTWSMIEFEADDALATFATRAADAPNVTQVRICSPDKDLCQCVRDQKIVLYDRKKKQVLDEMGVLARLGVRPARVPSLLALVGDTADGIPGITRWGERSSAAVLARFESIAQIPDDPVAWGISVRGKDALALELSRAREAALLYEKLATLRLDVPLPERIEDLAWRGPNLPELETLCQEIGAADVLARLKGDGGTAG